jgi:hypothetical protein
MVLISFFLRQVGWALTAHQSKTPNDQKLAILRRCASYRRGGRACKEADATLIHREPQVLKIISEPGVKCSGRRDKTRVVSNPITAALLPERQNR